ncbi:hypothetical protein LTR78_006997 [Recurvomyces mirabilis]|uniref:Uncharacterized protein n=1 Tax=Recurvomyces mirabilis TaxID=574656 RepID=A0AAE0WK42_9PEZI|nr:hypothetical protein LTR78_006997 [Recurvomyces mirabilis]KAK5153381.1 hypothetical protein LTS14_007550 [Recurvomyces mirabilis]
MARLPANPIRTYVITGAVAAITAVGTWYGAGLKTRQDYGQERKAVLEAPISERIEHMELAKTRLTSQKMALQNKIDKLTAKTAEAAKSEASPSAG